MSYRQPTIKDYEEAISKLVTKKCGLENKINKVKEIINSYEFNDDFKLLIISELLKEDENE